jgi:TM2 domain-containing membrane protein YozV
MCCPEETINPTNTVMGIVCLVLNIFFPGIGTMVNGCLGVHCSTGIIYGILQLLTAPLLIGWIWSIIYGIKILQLSGKDHHHHHHHHEYH